MQHIAIDLGGQKSQVCIRDVKGQILSERHLRTASLNRFLAGEPKSRVVLETCAEAFRVADWAQDNRHEVRVVPATLVRTLGVGSRRIKTDRRDAQILSEVSCRIDLPSVHVPTEVARARRSMCGARQQMVQALVSLINCVRGWTRTQLFRVRSGEVTTFPKRVRDAAMKHPNGLPEYIDRLLVAIECLNQQIAAADKELAALVKEDPICQRLMSIPGIGPVTSMRFVAALDDISRFPDAHSVQAFLGLTPGENSSSSRVHRTGITKAGPPAVRTALIQASWNFRRLRPNDPITLWAQGIEQRRGKFVATVALARKLAGIMFALWRDGATYQSNHEEQRNVQQLSA